MLKPNASWLVLLLALMPLNAMAEDDDSCPSAMVWDEASGSCRPAPGNAGLGIANTAASGTATADGLETAGSVEGLGTGGSGTGSLSAQTATNLSGQDISQGNI